MVTVEQMKSILKIGFMASKIHEESWSTELHQYTIAIEDAFIQAADGDYAIGYMCSLMFHWWNDIESFAPMFGIEFKRDADGKLIINEDVPPPPERTSEWYWDEGQWNKLEDEFLGEIATPQE